jgi:hypothetical protein
MKKFSFLVSCFLAFTSSCVAIDDTNDYVCGVFQSVLTSYDGITSNGNNDQACYTGTISYPAGQLTGDIECNPSGCGGGQACERTDPPSNRYNPTLPVNSRSGINEASSPTTLTNLEYGNLSYSKKTVTFAPDHNYTSSPTKVMLLGNVTIEKTTLRFEPGDYYFDSLTIANNNNEVIVPDADGVVRIFIRNNFNVAMNNLKFNTTGIPDNLFVYVGGDFTSLGNGGGTTSWKAFMYVNGSTTLNNNSNNWTIEGGITSEGPIAINGNNPDFIQTGNSDGFGMGDCQMCYALENGGMLIGFENFMSMSFGFPRNMGIANVSDETLSNVFVTQDEDTSGFSGGMGCYQVLDEAGNNLGRDIDVDYDGFGMSYSNCAAGMGETKVTADFGTYPSTGYDSYYLFQTYGFSGNFMGSSGISYYARYTSESGKNYNVKLDYCSLDTYNPFNPILGIFDAWEVGHGLQGATDDRNITTKIANNGFNLTVASVNEARDALELKPGITKVQYQLIDMLTNQNLTDWEDFNPSSTMTQTKAFRVDTARKDVRVRFKYCQNDADGSIALFEDCEKGDSNVSFNQNVISSDNFAIRPLALRAFGTNEYKRAGMPFELNIKAVNYDNSAAVKVAGTSTQINGVKNYNEALANLMYIATFYDLNASLEAAMIGNVGYAPVDLCPSGGNFTLENSTELFHDGDVNASLSYDETGILTISVLETPGSEFAIVDADDTGDTERYIEPTNLVLDRGNISKETLQLFIPFQFTTQATYDTTTGQNWIYMVDINDSNTPPFPVPSLAAYTEIIVTAQDMAGNTVQNFHKTCFPDVTEDLSHYINGLKLNSTFDLFLNLSINLPLIPDRNETQMVFYVTDNTTGNPEFTLTTDQWLQDGNNEVNQTLAPHLFTNGVASARVYFNVDRNISQARNPLSVTLTDVNTSTSWSWQPGATNIFNGALLNTTRTFIYGRTNVPRHTFIGNTGVATMYYESYCSGTDPFGMTCDRSLLPDGVLSKNVNDSRWFKNTLHASPTMGVVGMVMQSIEVNQRVTAGAPTQANPSTVGLTYDLSAGYPYLTEDMENYASTWLLHDEDNESAIRNKFEVEFLAPSSGWAGKKEDTETTIKDRVQSPTINRSIMW